ncbi:hypothetical protein LMG33810_001315 [Carnimonas sp. LMG 33810]
MLIDYYDFCAGVNAMQLPTDARHDEDSRPVLPSSENDQLWENISIALVFAIPIVLALTLWT